MNEHDEVEPELQPARERDQEDIKNPYANLMREVNEMDIKHLRFSPLKDDDRELPGTISELLLRMVAYKQKLAHTAGRLRQRLLHEPRRERRLRHLNALEDLRIKQTLLDAYYYLQLHNDLDAWEGPPFVTLRCKPDNTLVAAISATTERTYAERFELLSDAIDKRMEKEGLGLLLDDQFEKELRRKMDALNQPYTET